MEKEKIKRILSYIINCDMPEKLKREILDLLAKNSNNEKLINEFNNLVGKKIEFEDIERMRKINEIVKSAN